jgi:DUF3047 family protein
VRSALAFALMALAPPAAALGDAFTAFSALPPGRTLPPGWRELRVPKAPPAEIALVADAGATVLRVRSRASAGAAAFEGRAALAGQPMLAWRWKVDRVVARADMNVREGDDFAARVYVFFDIPEEALPLGARVKTKIARLLHGAALPTAALCYVWDNRHPPGTTAWNPYTDRVRMVVVESGGARAGEWIEARRDLEADFRAAFGEQWRKPVPAVTGLAAGNDTDQTGESATAWFGDFRLEARR